MSYLEYWKIPKNQSSSKKVSRSTRLSTRTKNRLIPYLNMLNIFLKRLMIVQ